jgi:PucR C-terminal helix-turn-helix domain
MTNQRDIEPWHGLPPEVADAIEPELPATTRAILEAIADEVPEYARPLEGSFGRGVRVGVDEALRQFVALIRDPGSGREPGREVYVGLGRGELRQGRTLDSLQAAYRVGARVAWRELSATAVASGVSAATIASFAELVFAYIDELSAASVAGHTDELETTGRVRQRYLDRLAVGLLRGEPADAVTEAAERADWTPPKTLTAVLLPESQVRPVLGLVAPGALTPSEHGLPEGLAVVLVPDMGGRSRTRLLRILADRHAVVGPARPWREVRTSYARAVRGLDLRRTAEPVDTEHHLASLVVSADPEALADLRARALAPLADVRPATAEKLEATLRSWLLHQGRREDVAADLFVHPQTVRYRMNQLRELYGDGLEDPQTVLMLTLALA